MEIVSCRDVFGKDKFRKKKLTWHFDVDFLTPLELVSTQSFLK